MIITQNTKRFTTPEAAAYLGISYAYLRNMRKEMHNHDGPNYIKARHKRGMACYYYQDELDRWKQTHQFRRDK